VIFDGADALSDDVVLRMHASASNLKLVERVVVTSRREPEIRTRVQLFVRRMPEVDSEALLRQKMLMADISETDILRVVGAVNGHPDALSIVATMAQSMSSQQLRRVLSGNLYDLKDLPGLDQHRLSRLAKPALISVSDDIILRLKKEPKDVHKLTPRQKDVHKLTPRQYEELIAIFCAIWVMK
jgi:hypothetical protein